MTCNSTRLRRDCLDARSGAALLGVFLCLVMPPAVARAGSGDRIGDAVAIVNTVFADFDRTQRTLTVGDDVRQDETIEVTSDARGELKLDDDTKLALGPGAKLKLDKFVYDSDKKAGTIVIDFAKGAFRFVTGVATKPTYVITTPNASITVRGTVFDTFVLPDESAWVLLHGGGGVEITGRKSACRVLDRPGQLVRISKTGVVSAAANWSKLTGADAADFDKAFPFVDNPPQTDPQPTLTREAILNGALADEPQKTCVNAKPPIKIQRADLDPDGGDKPKKSKAQKGDDDDGPPVVNAKIRVKKARAKDDDDKPKRTKTTKKQNSDDDDDSAAAAAAAAVIIGIGVGGGFRGRRGGDMGRHRGPN